MRKWIARFAVVHKENLCALALILFFIVFNFLSMQNKTRTADEDKHYSYGMNILNLNSDRLQLPSGIFDDSKMPITALNALPAWLAQRLPASAFKNQLNKFYTARFVTVLFSALVAWLVFRWSRSLYGFIPALGSLFLYVLDPNIIAHSELVTTDVYAAGMIAFSFYWLWKFANSRKTSDGLIFVLVLGLSQLAKFTCVVLFPLALLAILGHDWFFLKLRDKKYFVKLFMYTLLAVVIAVFIINLGYLFNRTFTPFKDYQLESNGLLAIQTKLPWLGNIPVPTPYPFLQGLDLISYRNSTSLGYGNIYMLGQLHKTGGFKGFYFVASFFKVPIASQLVLLAAMIFYFWDKQRRARFWKDGIFFFVPVVFFTIYLNFFLNAQLGIRLYLVVFPLLYVFAGHLFQNWQAFTKPQRALTFILAAYLAASVFSYYPDYIPYFNEFVWDRRMAYKILVDSDLDWGQSKYYLSQYMAAHPNVQQEPDRIVIGRIVISPNELVGRTVDPSTYAWLRDNFVPVDVVAHTYLVYDVHSPDLVRLCQTKSICP